MKLLDAVEGRSIVVVLGNGGVGKTTVASAVALLAARAGRRVLVVTVDPSNRLKQSLGLSGRPGVEESVSLPDADRDGRIGSLHAMILDAATEMDRLVKRLVPDAGDRARITDNVFYRKAASYMAGTHEYMAMERLLEAHESGRYDLIVLDTPPERHALDFLDAPARLGGLLSSEVFRLFVTASSGLSRLGLGALRWRSVILKGISRFAGEETFLAILDFVLAFQPMFDGFRHRAEKVGSWFIGPGCATMVVCRPGRRCAGEVRATMDALEGRSVAPAAIVANRVRVWPPPGSAGQGVGPVDLATLAGALESNPAMSLAGRDEITDLAKRTIDLANRYRDLTKEDCEHLVALRAVAGSTPVFEIPLLKGEVSDLESLAGFARVVDEARWSFRPT
ncbi:MAG: AAA family ATPase [Deltaproteobacteria bacterium]|nr:AAA family ATPase [Deltaproteobacteria bacterium]